MSTHVIRVRNGTATPTSKLVAVGDDVRWVGPPGSMVGIYFGPKTPVGWQSNNGPTVTGTVQKVPFDSYPYKPKHSFVASEAEPESEPAPAPAESVEDRAFADPELIVSGGLQPKRKPTRTKRAAPVKRTKKASTRAATKRAKATTRASSTKRAKTKRAKTKSAKTTRRAKSTKRAKTKRAKR